MRALVKLLVVFGVSFIASTAPVMADESNFNFKYVDGPYIIIANHNVHAVQAGVPVTYNVRLYTVENGLPADFQRVQVYIKHDGRLDFGKSLLVSPDKDASFSYTYPKADKYTLSLRFVSDAKLLAAGDFPIVVQPDPHAGGITKALNTQTLLAFLIGAAVASLALQYNRLKVLFSPKRR
jgi:hypothetical protein